MLCGLKITLLKTAGLHCLLVRILWSHFIGSETLGGNTHGPD
uniref:Uncharacterized protein n=1 Tax=Anguilla anguilla TaxID=7936 RepID=A0A0E9VGX4_ANGAN